MGFPSERNTLAKNSGKSVEGQQMASYDSVEESLADLFLWFDYTKFPDHLTSLKDFVTALKARNYFNAGLRDYYNGVESWL